MNKLLLIIGVLLISFQTTYAQKKSKDYSVKWTPEQQSKKKFIFTFLGHDNTGYYAQTTDKYGENVTLNHYSGKKMKLTKTFKLRHKRRIKFSKLLYLDNKLLLFTTSHNRKSHMRYLYMQTVNKKTLLPNNDRKKIDEFKYADSSDEYAFEISQDSSKVLIYKKTDLDDVLRIFSSSKKEIELVSLRVFDQNMNKLWSKDINLPYKKEMFDERKYKVDNTGDVYILGRLYSNKKDKKNNINYKYTVLSYSKEHSKEKIIDLVLKDNKFVRKVIMTVDKNRDYLFYGIYSGSDMNAIKGLFFLKIDNLNNRIIHKDFQELKDDMLIYQVSKEKRIYSLKYMLKDFIIKDDGSFIIIGEYQSTQFNQGNSHYFFRDILISRISAQGKFIWTNKLEKFVSSMNYIKPYVSYAKMITKDNVYFLYNDNPRNITKSKKDDLYALNELKKSVIVLAKFDKNGELTKKIIDKSGRQVSTPANIIIDNQMIILTKKRKRYKFGILNFKK